MQDLLDEGGVGLRDAPQAWQLLVHLTHQSAAARRGRGGRVVLVLLLQAAEHLVHLPGEALLKTP